MRRCVACEGARPLPVGCHSSPLKLGAVRVLGVQGSGGKQLRGRRDGSAPSDDSGPASKTRRCNESSEPVLEPP